MTEDTTSSEQKSEQQSLHPINIDFSVAYTQQKEIKQTKQEFLLFCPTFDVLDADQLPLWRVLTVGRHLNIPILQLLYSCYMRDRIHCLLTQQTGLGFAEFVDKSPTVRRILQSKHNNNLQKRIEKDITESLKLFFTRRCSQIQLPPLDLIDDDINKYAQIIIETVKFIKRSIHDPHSKLTPYQIDLWIIPKNIQKMTDIDSSDDDDDDGSNYDTVLNESKTSDIDDDELGDIDNRLESNECVYIKSDMTYYGKNSISRAFNREFIKKIKVKYANNDLVYPHRERACIIVDRRSNTTNKENGDPLYIFQPKQYNRLPVDDNIFPEWCIEATCNHILPSFGSNDKDEEDVINGQKSCKGLMFCISFQVQEANIQRCWLYHRSQIHRFQVMDIVELLPRLFKEGRNKLNDDIKEQVIEGVKKHGLLELKDDPFDSIYSPIAT